MLASDCYSTKYTHDIVNDMLKYFEIDAKSEDLINVVEGFIGPGYGLTNEADLGGFSISLGINISVNVLAY